MSIAVYKLKKLKVIRTQTNSDFKELLEEFDELTIRVSELKSDLEQQEYAYELLEQTDEVHRNQIKTLEKEARVDKKRIKELEQLVDELNSKCEASEAEAAQVTSSNDDGSLDI